MVSKLRENKFTEKLIFVRKTAEKKWNSFVRNFLSNGKCAKLILLVEKRRSERDNM